MLFFLGIATAVIAFRFWQTRMSFRGQRPEDYSLHHPTFDLRTSLDGRFVCEGVIFGPTGRAMSRFEADVEASWTGDTGTLKEHFRYDSGATQEREWRLHCLEDGHVEARADDVVGTGAGRASGSAFMLTYRIRLPADAGGYVLDVVDWMYLLENGTIVNRSQFRKFGFKVVELVAVFRRPN